MEKNIYQKLQQARVDLLQKATKKSGKNKFAGFEYFELKDFVPQLTEILNTYGLTSIFSITPERTHVLMSGETYTDPEMAILKIVDGTSEILFQTPTADAMGKGQLPIQALGSKITYLRRYLYLMALDIVENDVIDALTGGNEEPTSKTAERIMQDARCEKLKSYYSVDELKEIVAQYNVKKIQELDKDVIRKLIEAKNG